MLIYFLVGVIKFDNTDQKIDSSVEMALPHNCNVSWPGQVGILYRNDFIY